MGCLTSVAGLVESFILAVTPPDLFTIGLIALVAAPDLLAKMTTATDLRTAGVRGAGLCDRSHRRLEDVDVGQQKGV